MDNIFTGLITALITPFNKGVIDLNSLEKILKYQIAGGVNGIVVGGSTGEGTSLTLEEYKLLINTAKEIVKTNIPIIVGCSFNNTAYAAQLADLATKIGTDGFMASVPPYIKPTQEGIYKHFEAIHNASNIPIMLYSVTARTITDFTDETIFKLAQLPRIVALKDAGKDLERPLRIKARLKDFNLLSGNDEVALAFNAQGGKGCVSVASNIAPKLCKQLQDYCAAGNMLQAFKLQQQLLPLYKALFAETNPIPVKYAAYHLGLCLNELRLPLTEATDKTIELVNEVLRHYSL